MFVWDPGKLRIPQDMRERGPTHYVAAENAATYKNIKYKGKSKDKCACFSHEPLRHLTAQIPFPYIKDVLYILLEKLDLQLCHFE